MPQILMFNHIILIFNRAQDYLTLKPSPRIIAFSIFYKQLIKIFLPNFLVNCKKSCSKKFLPHIYS